MNDDLKKATEKAMKVDEITIQIQSAIEKIEDYKAELESR